MILAISSRTDEHTQRVMAELSRLGAEAAIVDLSEFPQSMSLAMRYNDRGHVYKLDLVDKGEILLSDCSAVWWRRPQAFVPHLDVVRPADRNFILSESHEAFAGLWQALDTFWMNDPVRDQVASHKVHQLKIAQYVGMCVPPTLITNDPNQARDFVDQLGTEHTVYKAFTATAADWRETRILRPEEVPLLANVRYAPVIFQKYVPARVDLRVTAVGEEIFAAAIHSQQSAYKYDFRMDMANATVEPWDLPDQLQRQLRALMSRLGITYGAIDLRLTPDGSYVFLEVNPAGQWLFIEERTRQAITAAVAALLADGKRRRRNRGSAQ